MGAEELAKGTPKSIAFPSLGTGVYGNSKALSAKAAADAVEQFKQKCPNSKLNIKFSVHPDFVKAYKDQEKEIPLEREIKEAKQERVKQALERLGFEVNIRRGGTNPFEIVASENDRKILTAAFRACKKPGQISFMTTSTHLIAPADNNKLLDALAENIESEYQKLKNPVKTTSPPPKAESKSSDSNTDELFSTSHTKTPDFAHKQSSEPPLKQDPIVETLHSFKEVEHFLEKNKRPPGISTITSLGEGKLSVQLKAEGEDKHPLNYYVCATPTGGAQFSMKAGLAEQDATKIIEHACQVAVATAKPGAEITIAENAPNKALVQQALQHHIDQAIKDRKFTQEDAPKIKSSAPTKSLKVG